MYTNHNFKIINIDKTDVSENFYCNICLIPRKFIEDFNKNDTYDCCHECFLQFVETRKSDWSAGWRPDEKKIKAYINLRKEIALNIIKSKGE